MPSNATIYPCHHVSGNAKDAGAGVHGLSHFQSTAGSFKVCKTLIAVYNWFCFERGWKSVLLRREVEWQWHVYETGERKRDGGLMWEKPPSRFTWQRKSVRLTKLAWLHNSVCGHNSSPKYVLISSWTSQQNIVNGLPFLDQALAYCIYSFLSWQKPNLKIQTNLLQHWPNSTGLKGLKQASLCYDDAKNGLSNKFVKLIFQPSLPKMVHKLIPQNMPPFNKFKNFIESITKNNYKSYMITTTGLTIHTRFIWKHEQVFWIFWVCWHTMGLQGDSLL